MARRRDPVYPGMAGWERLKQCAAKGKTMEFETLLSGWEFLEAPRLDAHGNLYFSDVTIGGLHKRLPDGEVESFLPGRTWIGGIAFNDDGGIVCSGKSGLICFYEDTGEVRQLSGELDGGPIGAINDFY